MCGCQIEISLENRITSGAPSYKEPFYSPHCVYIAMMKVKFTSALVLESIVSVVIVHFIFISSNTSDTAIAQPLIQTPEELDIGGNQTMSPGGASEPITYSNSDLGF